MEILVFVIFISPLLIINIAEHKPINTIISLYLILCVCVTRLCRDKERKFIESIAWIVLQTVIGFSLVFYLPFSGIEMQMLIGVVFLTLICYNLLSLWKKHNGYQDDEDELAPKVEDDTGEVEARALDDYLLDEDEPKKEE